MAACQRHETVLFTDWSCSSLFVGFDDTLIDDPQSPIFPNFVTTWLWIHVSFVSTHPSIQLPSRLALKGIRGVKLMKVCLWKCQWGITGQREREYIWGGRGDGTGKIFFSWTLNCKMEDPEQTMAVINRLWWEVSRKSPMAVHTHWKTEKKRRIEREREGVTERDTDRNAVCVTISLGKESPRGRKQKE